MPIAIKKYHPSKTKFLFLSLALLLIISIPAQVFALTMLWNTPLSVSPDETYYTSMAVIDGKPAICYQRDTTAELMYVDALNRNGTRWDIPVTVDTGIAGRYCSLAQVNGTPAISYRKSAGDLYYVRASNSDGSAWNTPVLLDTRASYISMAVINGLPVIAYQSDNTGLTFISAQDENGTFWNSPQTLDNNGIVGISLSLLEVDGVPAVSYYDFTNENLKFIRAQDAGGVNWYAPQILDNSDNVGALPSLAIVNGNPAISYYDLSSANLKYIRAADASGTTWNAPQTLDSTGNVGAYSSMAVINGYPMIAYFHAGNEKLKFISAADAEGKTWNTPQVLDDMFLSSIYGEAFISLVAINGQPAISYSGNYLHFIRAIGTVDISIWDGAAQINNSDSYDFGSTTVGSPLTATLNIQNNGQTALSLNRLFLPSGYSLTDIYPNEIASGSSQNIQIRLEAYQTGIFSGNLSLSSTDDNLSPFTIALTGKVTEDALNTGIIAPLNGSTVLDSSIQVAFNHDVLHDGSAEAADNPVNYLLVEDGTNGLFETATCLAGVAGDDVQQTITGVTYDASIFTATLNTGTLPSGRYQLLVCGTASIADASGNVLNNGVFDSSTTFTVVSSASGTGTSGTAGTTSTAFLPATGFAPNQATALPAQPAELAYNDMDSLSLQIPSLKVDVPIVGVPQTANGWDVTWLTNRQAGWLNGSAYPTWDGNTVLTGHVTNASGNPGPFANIKTLKFGDQLTIQAYGETYTYEVRENKLVTRDDMSIIEEHKSRDWVTLITCEYFNETTGEYLYRRVVRAVLVEVE